jgi:hypothetical protein
LRCLAISAPPDSGCSVTPQGIKRYSNNAQSFSQQHPNLQRRAYRPEIPQIDLKSFNDLFSVSNKSLCVA